MKKSALITGAEGFIGSHLCEMAAKKGFNVIAFDRYNPNNDHGWLNNTNYKNLKIILGDVRDYDSVHKSMKGCNCPQAFSPQESPPHPISIIPSAVTAPIDVANCPAAERPTMSPVPAITELTDKLAD